MHDFFREKGLVHQTSCAYTPEQNGVAERKNRYILEITRALLLESKIPKSFWPEAVATAVYLLNRLPTGILNFKSPLDIFSNHFELPSSLSLEPRVFGCTVFVHIPKHERNKFSPCALKCVFLGYGKNQKGYRCYDPNTRQVHTTMNCDFVEGEYFYGQSSSQGETQPLDRHLNSDLLNWLPTPTTTIVPRENHSEGEPQSSPITEVGPTEEVNGTDGPSQPVIQNEVQSDIDQRSDPTSIPEVQSSNIDTIAPENANDDRNNGSEGETNGRDRETEQPYELPPSRDGNGWKPIGFTLFRP